MPRLPVPGSDSGSWGQILNEYLEKSHADDGSLKPNTVGASQIQNNSIPVTKLDPAVQTALNTVSSGVAPDATTSTKGIIRLSGDLTGSALAPLIAPGAVTGGGGGNIATGTITDANIHTSAAIAKSKLAPLAVTDADIAASASIAQSKINGLVSDLAGKAASSHAHTISSVTGLQAALDGKADDTEVQAALSAKANAADIAAALASKANTSDVTSGLAGKAAVSHTHTTANVTGLQAELTALANSVATKADASVVASDLASKASISHTHTTADITSLDQHVTNIIGNKLIPGSNVSINFDSETGETVISSTGGGGGTPSETVTTVAGRTGDVVLVAGDITAGTLSSSRIPSLDTSKITTGTLEIARLPLGTTGSSVAAGNHTHTGYATASHLHAVDDVNGLQTALDSKAGTTHTHSITNVTNLQDALDDKASNTHTHGAADITSGSLDVARIPGLAASKITSGTFDIARIPTGTSGTTVALGDHGHVNYAAISHTHDDRYYTETEVDAVLSAKLNTSEKGSTNGVATLGSDGKIPASQIPAIAINETFTVANQGAMLALTAQRGDMAIRTDMGRTYVLASDSPSTLADWKELTAAGQVSSVAGKTGAVSIVKGDVGLGNVDNTSDSAKPISAATQAALDTKAETTDPRFTDQRTPLNNSVTTAKIANGAVTAEKIAGGAMPNGFATLDSDGKLVATQLPTRLSEATLDGRYVLLPQLLADNTTDIGPILQALINSGAQFITLPYAPDKKYYINTPVFWPSNTFGRGRVTIDLGGNILRLGNGLPTVTEFAPDSNTRFAFFPNTLATALSGGTVTVAGQQASTSGGQVLSLTLSNGTIESPNSGNVGAVFYNRSPVELHNIAMLGGKCAVSGYEYTDGMQITGHAHFRSSSSSGLGTQVSDAWYYYQITEGDGVFIQSIKSDGLVGGVSMEKCRGANIHGVVTSSVRLSNCEGINIHSAHMETDIYTSDGPRFTITSSSVNFYGGVIYRPSATSGVAGSVIINDSHNERSSEVLFDGTVFTTLQRFDTGDATTGAHVYVLASNNGTSTSNTRMVFREIVSKVASSGSSNAGIWRRSAGPFLASAQTTLDTAMNSIAAKAQIASGSFEVTRALGTWFVQKPGFPGFQLRNAATTPTLNLSTANQASGGLPNTPVYYTAAIRDASGAYTIATSPVTATPTANGTVRILVQASGPGVLVLWRKTGSGVENTPDRYIELPLSSPRLYVFDTGNNVNQQAWKTTGIPIPSTVASTDATAHGVLIVGNAWPA